MRYARVYVPALGPFHTICTAANRMHKENYSITFYVRIIVFIREMRLDNFLYAYVYVAIQICVDKAGNSCIKLHFHANARFERQNKSCDQK